MDGAFSGTGTPSEEGNDGRMNFPERGYVHRPALLRVFEVLEW
jgi:hypothetical protein